MRAFAQAIPTDIKWIDINRREATSLGVAAALHLLLLLWTGMPLKMLDAENKNRDVLVQVEFRSDMPTMGAAQAARAQRKKGFMAKVKSFFKKSAPAQKDSGQLAKKSEQEKIDIEKKEWDKVASTFKNKTFSKKDSFDGLNKTKEISVAKGSNNDKLTMSKMKSDFKKEDPVLNEKSYRLAQKDTPFKIVKPKTNDALALTNAVPVNVGKKTSANIKSMPDALSSGGGLKSKSFSGSDGLAGGGTLSKGSSSKISNTSLAMGSGGTASGSGGGGKLASSGSYGRSPGSYGSTSFGAGGSAPSTIKGSPSGSNSGTAKKGGSKNAGFKIQGELQNRQILKKFFPKATMDARVALRFRVDWAGRVLDGIVIVISSGFPSFDQKVLSSLKEWIFSKLPTSKSNVVQEGTITFRFKGV